MTYRNIILYAIMAIGTISWAQQPHHKALTLNFTSFSTSDLLQSDGHEPYGKLYPEVLKKDYRHSKSSYPKSLNRPYQFSLLYAVPSEKRTTQVIGLALSRRGAYYKQKSDYEYTPVFDTIQLLGGGLMNIDSVTYQSLSASTITSALTFEYGIKYSIPLSDYYSLTVTPRLRAGIHRAKVELEENEINYIEYKLLPHYRANSQVTIYPIGDFTSDELIRFTDTRTEWLIGAILPIQFESKLSSNTTLELGGTLIFDYQTTQDIPDHRATFGLSAGVSHFL